MFLGYLGRRKKQHATGRMTPHPLKLQPRPNEIQKRLHPARKRCALIKHGTDGLPVINQHVFENPHEPPVTHVRERHEIGQAGDAAIRNGQLT
jgi:hypothetical protein